MKLPLCCLSLLLVLACGSEKTPSGSSDSGQSRADTGVSTVVDTGVNGPVDSGVNGNVDTGVANPADTGVANPADTGVANPADTGVANPADTGVAPADSGVVDLPDAGSMTDAGPGICVPPAGYTGNSKNVGAACTPGGGECRQYSFAGLCSIDLDPQGDNFCIHIGCRDHATCGEMACCTGRAGSAIHACVPKGCLVGDISAECPPIP